MNILAVGSLRKVPVYAELCKEFVRRLGEVIVDRNHILLTGCRGSLDEAIAEAACKRLEEIAKESRPRLISYRLKNAEPVHRYGTIRVSSLTDWELTHPDLNPPEQLVEADVAILIAGGEGTFIAANWARIAGKPILGVAQFGGAGEAIYERERSRVEARYYSFVSTPEFDMLNQDTLDMGQLANDVISLAERIISPKAVFTVMPFTSEFRDVYASYSIVCKEFEFDAVRTDESESTERIVPRIIEGIRYSAFVIADVSDISPNVFYEIGFAQGLGKPVILTAKKGTVLPFDIADVPVVFWDGQEDLKDKLRRRIEHVASGLRR